MIYVRILQKQYFSVLSFYEKQRKSEFLSRLVRIHNNIKHVYIKLQTVTYFTKTLFFCANFLRKVTKIKIYDQLHFVILRTIFQPCVKYVAYKQIFNNVNSCDNII
jgi:hypothetical protein